MASPVRAISLISGGIDSPVATYLALEAGLDVDVLHFDNRPFTDDRQVAKVGMIVAHLEKAFGRRIRHYAVPHKKNQVTFAREAERSIGCVLCRRQMWRMAGMVATKLGAEAVVTGESLGQVASQTLSNIRTEDCSVPVPILRPLIGMDKTEIITVARRIGTYEISILPGLCCTIVPERPATRSDLVQILPIEQMLDVGSMAESAVAQLEVIEH